MADINNAPMVNSADLRKVITDPNALTRLIRALHHGEHGQHRALGAGRHPGSIGRGGGNDGADISREKVQEWLNNGQLELRDEPAAGSTDAKLRGSPKAFLTANNLTDPRQK